MSYAYDTTSYAVCFSVRSCATPRDMSRRGTLYYVLLFSKIIGQHKKWSPLGGSRSREIGIFKRLLRSYPEHFILCFCWLFESINLCFVLFEQKPYLLPARNTTNRKRHHTQTICITPLQSILEEGSHSRQSFLARLTNRFDAFFNSKNASETKAANK